MYHLDDSSGYCRHTFVANPLHDFLSMNLPSPPFPFGFPSERDRRDVL